MIPFILGGVALAVTGYGIKKYLEDEDNCRKVEDTVDDWLNSAEKGTNKFFDYANEKIDQLDVKLNGKRESYDEEKLEDEPCDEVQNDKQNDKQSDESTNQDKNTTQTKSWNKTSDWI